MADDDTTPPKAPAASAVDPAADAKQLADGRAAIRQLLQRTGAIFGAAATAILAGIGYSQLNNIFPVPHNINWWVWDPVLIAAAIAALLGSLLTGAIFLRAQRQIVLDSSRTKIEDGKSKDPDLNSQEAALANRIKDEHAREEQAQTLRDVELRALRLERLARRLGDEAEAKALQAESDRLYWLVSIAISRAATAILEDRSRRAFYNLRTFFAVALAAFGIAGLFSIADYYKGERDKVALRVACQKAEHDGVASACAPIETNSQTKKRTDAENRLKAKNDREAAAKATAAAARLSPKQRVLISRIAACDAAIEARPSKQTITLSARAQAVALCAVAG